jgi:hypothetical protein
MKWATVGVLLMLVASLVFPAVAAGNEEKYSYITVEDVVLHLEEEQAAITIHYQIDDGIGFLVLLLGKSDLQRKVDEILNFEDAEIQSIDLEHAEVLVENASENYGQGSYWFPEHRFRVVVPSLTIITPQNVRHYENVSEITGGLGYFARM